MHLVSTPSLLTLLCLFLLVPGCTHRRVSDVRFRTEEPETALERAATALEQTGHGVYRIDPSTGRVLTRWKDADTKVGLSYVFYRYVATVLPDATRRAADVQLRLEAVKCSLVDTRDPDRMAQECSPQDFIPAKVRESFQRTSKTFEFDLASAPSGRG